jgi:hypothetical protein
LRQILLHSNNQNKGIFLKIKADMANKQIYMPFSHYNIVTIPLKGAHQLQPERRALRSEEL